MSERIKKSLDARGNYKPLSDNSLIEGFIKDSSIYRDFKGEIECRIEDLRNVLETAGSKEFHFTQGAILLSRQFLNIFDDMLANRISDLEEEALKREEAEQNER